MAPLPLLKLVGLLVKTLAKPVASRMKVEARKHPTFTKTCVTIGELSHQITSRMNVLASGYKFLGVSPLEKEEALSKGIDFLSEAFIFCVAGSIIIIEYARSEVKAAQKAKEQAESDAQFRNYLEGKFNRLSDETEILHRRIRELEILVLTQTELIENLQKKKQQNYEEKSKHSKGSPQISYWNWLGFS